MGNAIQSGAMLGDLNVLIYDYPKPGDILPMHNHDEDTSHIVICAKGSVVVLTQNQDGSIDSQHVEAGTVLDTFAGYPHAVVGVTEGARTIHIQKHMVKYEHSAEVI